MILKLNTKGLSSMDKDNWHYIQKIKFYAETIVDFTKNETYTSFTKNQQINFAISFSLIQIGEAAGNLRKSFTDKYNHIPWKNITGIRHRVVHDYEGSNMSILWEAATESIPELIIQVNYLIESLEKEH